MTAETTFLTQTPPLADALAWLQDARALAGDAAPSWVQALRATAAESFAAVGLPAPSREGWQYTNLRPLSGIRFRYATDPVTFDAAKIPPPLPGVTHRLVFVNGQYQASLSISPPALTVQNLMDAARSEADIAQYLVNAGALADEPLQALNAAYFRDGAVLDINGDAGRVEILFYSIGKNNPAIYPRLFYRLRKNAAATLIERHMGEGVYLANSHATALLEQDSRLRLYKFEEESLNAFHFSKLTLQQHKNSQFEGFSCASGAALAREEYQNQLLESDISCNVGGIYLLRGHQNHDFTVLVDHFEPAGTSAQRFRGVADDQARTVFQGKIHVRRVAQKTDANQSHHALLLSSQAEANFKPELEIYADDVKCGHGATSGHLDSKALLYLRSRGIPERQARALLIESFLKETLEGVSDEVVRNMYAERISAWLST